MGSWGTGLFSDDLAHDVRNMYHDYLALGYDDIEAERQVQAYYCPQVVGTEDEPLFWLSLAAVEQKYGRLSTEIKERALRIIENGSDLERWEGAQRKKREAVLKTLEEKLNGEPRKREKVKPPVLMISSWKKGDVILVRFLQQDNSAATFFAMQVFDVVDIPYSAIIKDERDHRIAIIGIYRWIGNQEPKVEELVKSGFIREYFILPDGESLDFLLVMCLTVTQKECEKYGCKVIANNDLYLRYVDEDEIEERKGRTLGGFESGIAMLLNQIQK